MKKLIFVALLVFSCSLYLPSRADIPASPPSKESLLAAWEQAQKESPSTVEFKRTSEKNVYNYETTFFPYKGKLKVLNLLIQTSDSIYDDEGYSTTGYSGVIELQLPDAPKDFRDTYSRSYYAWDRNNTFHFDPKASKWFTSEEWSRHQNAIRAAQKVADSSSPSDSIKPTAFENIMSHIYSVFISWFPMLLLIGVWVYFMRQIGKQARRPGQEGLPDIYKKLAELVEIHKELAERLKQR